MYFSFIIYYFYIFFLTMSVYRAWKWSIGLFFIGCRLGYFYFAQFGIVVRKHIGETIFCIKNEYSGTQSSK